MIKTASCNCGTLAATIPDELSAVFGQTEFKPDEIGTAEGAFADPSFPASMYSVWEHSRHPWASFTINLPRYLKGRSAGPIPE